MFAESLVYNHAHNTCFSHCRHNINIAVLEMRENGDLLKMEQKWWYSKGECGTADGGVRIKNSYLNN